MQRESGITCKFCSDYSIGLRVLEKSLSFKAIGQRRGRGKLTSEPRSVGKRDFEKPKFQFGNRVRGTPRDSPGGGRGGITILVRPHNIASKTAKIPKGGPKTYWVPSRYPYKGPHPALRKAARYCGLFWTPQVDGKQCTVTIAYGYHSMADNWGAVLADVHGP